MTAQKVLDTVNKIIIDSMNYHAKNGDMGTATALNSLGLQINEVLKEKK